MELFEQATNSKRLLKTSLVGDLVYLLPKTYFSCPYNQCGAKSHNLVMTSNSFHYIRTTITFDVLVGQGWLNSAHHSVSHHFESALIPVL